MQNSRRRCGAEHKNGDPWENRTPDFAVRGRRLSRLTKGPYFGEKAGFSPNKEKSRHLPIFPGRLQPSIFGTAELNDRVRNGNGWDLSVIITDFGAPTGTRTRDPLIKSQLLYQLSYWCMSWGSCTYEGTLETK